MGTIAGPAAAQHATPQEFTSGVPPALDLTSRVPIAWRPLSALSDSTAEPAGRGWQPEPAGARSWLTEPAGAFASSLVLPGAGQAALGLRRWPVYLLLEAGFWWGWTDSRGDARGLRRAYRDLAWDVARTYDGPRQDGGWGYYEAMSHYSSSGRYDADAADGLQPEDNPDTYNGTIWDLARGLYLPEGVVDTSAPEYALALSYYGERAAGPEFLWDWDGREEELGEFRSLIGSADDASRKATGFLGLILANHLISAVDALIVARLRVGPAVRLRSGLVPGPRSVRWRVELRIPLTD